MGKTALTAPPGFNKLTVPQKIDYVQFLWNSIAADEDSVPVPEWQRALVDKRLAEYRADPGAALNLDAVLESIDEKLRTRRG